MHGAARVDRELRRIGVALALADDDRRAEVSGDADVGRAVVADRPGEIDRAAVRRERRRARRFGIRHARLTGERLPAVGRAAIPERAFVFGPDGVNHAVGADHEIEASVMPVILVDAALAVTSDRIGEVLRF